MPEAGVVYVIDDDDAVGDSICMLFESYGIGPLVHMPQVRTAFITPAREAALIWHGRRYGVPALVQIRI